MNPQEYFIVNEGDGVFLVRILQVSNQEVSVEQLCSANPRGEAGWYKEVQPRTFTQEQISNSYWSLFARPNELAIREVVYEI